MITILLIVLAVLGLATLGFLALKKMPNVRVVDPTTSPEVKARERKYAVLEQRFTRQTGERLAALSRTAAPIFRKIQELFRRGAGKLTALERRYAERQKRGGSSNVSSSDLTRLVDEASAFMGEEKFDAAEKVLIEVLSHDPKNVKAYETIARLYKVTGNMVNAREALTFAHKLAPKDASICAALGEMAEEAGEAAKAYEYFSKARDLSPSNPKYLDFFITAASEVGDVLEATRALDKLREVNPDNQKIPEFEEVIEAARKRNKKETK